MFCQNRFSEPFDRENKQPSVKPHMYLRKALFAQGLSEMWITISMGRALKMGASEVECGLSAEVIRTRLRNDQLCQQPAHGVGHAERLRACSTFSGQR